MSRKIEDFNTFRGEQSPEPPAPKEVQFQPSIQFPSNEFMFPPRSSSKSKLDILSSTSSSNSTLSETSYYSIIIKENQEEDFISSDHEGIFLHLDSLIHKMEGSSSA